MVFHGATLFSVNVLKHDTTCIQTLITASESESCSTLAVLLSLISCSSSGLDPSNSSSESVPKKNSKMSLNPSFLSWIADQNSSKTTIFRRTKTLDPDNTGWEWKILCFGIGSMLNKGLRVIGLEFKHFVTIVVAGGQRQMVLGDWVPLSC